MQINFKEKSMTFDAPLSVFDAAAAAELVTRAHIAARVNGKLVGMTQIIDADADVELLTFEDADGKHVFRHTASHILAQAVKRLYPATKLTIGPAIDNGFYYDFDSDVSFTPDVLKALEGEMKKIVKENHKIERFELPRAEANAFMTERDEPYKVQLIEELPEDATISFYRQGDFVDLCAGPHLPQRSLGEGGGGVEVVVEAVVDGGADGQLDLGVQALHGLSQNVRAGMPVSLAVFFVFKGVQVFFRHVEMLLSMFRGKQKMLHP